MATEMKTIIVEPDSELAAVVDQAADGPVLLEKNGQQFRLSRETNEPMANYDPERTLEALRQSRGIFSAAEAEELKAYIREQRGHDCDSRSA